MARPASGVEGESPRSEASSEFPNLTRREALTRTGAATSVGVVGTVLAPGSAAAASTDCIWEQDTSAQYDHYSDIDYLTLTTDTDLCYYDWNPDVDRHRFRAATCAQTEYPQEGESVRAIRKHRMTVKSCQDELIPDISENEVGTVPPDTSNTVDTDFGDVAGVAIDVVAAAVGVDIVITALDGVAETADLLGSDSDCSGHLSEYKIDRVWDGDTARQDGTTTQAEWAVEIPTGQSSGQFVFESYTYAEDSCCSVDPAWVEIENWFLVTVNDDGGCSLDWYESSMDSGDR